MVCGSRRCRIPSRLVAVLLTFLATVAVLPSAIAHAEEPLDDLAKAMERSAKTKQPMFVYVYDSI